MRTKQLMPFVALLAGVFALNSQATAGELGGGEGCSWRWVCVNDAGCADDEDYCELLAEGGCTVEEAICPGYQANNCDWDGDDADNRLECFYEEGGGLPN